MRRMILMVASCAANFALAQQVSPGNEPNGKPRVAVLDFYEDGNDYRDHLWGKELADILSAHLGDFPGTDLVERGQSPALWDELELAAFSGPNAASALRMGHWLKADIIVHGNWRERRGARNPFDLRIVDAMTGSVLASEQLDISSGGSIFQGERSRSRANHGPRT